MIIIVFFAIFVTLLVLNRTIGDIGSMYIAAKQGYYRDNFFLVRLFLYTLFSILWTAVFYYYY